MSYRLGHLPVVQEDISEAIAWHQTRVPAFAERFSESYEAAFARILQNPELYAPDEDGLRRVKLEPFSYQVGYAFAGDLILVLGVIHTSRHPGIWTTRLNGDA